MANVFGSVVIQDLTYTQKVHGQAFTITYENGGTAGSETVRINQLEVIIKIASGTSTATQIRTAFNASAAAVAIATCTVSGTGSNAQKSGVRAFLSGGANAVAAALPIKYEMRLQAKTTGTDGNSIRFRFTSGGSGGAAVVTVSTNDISVQIENGVTTYQTVKNALDADSGAAALVTVYTPNDLSQFTATSGDMSSYTALSGGTASSNQAVVIQDLTFTSTTTGPSAKRQSITYTHGATAGSEVVTLDANGSETIQIQNGVSTATQIKAAHDASAPALALRTVAITGTGSTAQKTVNLEGGTSLSSEATPSTKDYYISEATAALTGSFVHYDFGFHASHITIHNDETSGAEYLEYSFDGVNVGGRVLATDQVALDQLEGRVCGISLRGDADAYRVNVTGV